MGLTSLCSFLSLLKKVKELNNFSDKKKFVNLICNGDRVGLVHIKIADIIIESNLPYLYKNNSLILRERNKNKLNITLENTSDLLVKKKIIKVITGEMFPCTLTLGGRVYFLLDRALVEYLGIRGYGVHLIAYVKDNKKIKIWTPRRAKNKRVEPNKLDNTVAGGISAGETVYEALVRESYEEAALEKNIISTAVLSGTINYTWRNKDFSLRRDTLFLYDLEVSKNIIPKNMDGELVKFRLLSEEKIMEKIQKTNDFKKNCVLVLASFLIKRGLINNDNECDYEEICRLL